MLLIVVLHRIIASTDTRMQHRKMCRRETLFISIINNRDLQRKLVQQVRHQPTTTTQSTHRGNYFLVSGSFRFFVSEDPVPPGAKLPHVL